VHNPLLKGAGHCVDLPYVFGSYPVFVFTVPNDAKQNYRLSQAVIEAWTSFARTGNPNSSSSNGSSSSSSSSSSSGSGSSSSTSGTDSLPFWKLARSGPTGSGSSSSMYRDSGGEELMVIDYPLENSRCQRVNVEKHFPRFLELIMENDKAMFFTEPG